jgi:hypothetical protein
LQNGLLLTASIFKEATPKASGLALGFKEKLSSESSDIQPVFAAWGTA